MSTTLQTEKRINLHQLNLIEKKDLTRQTYARKSYFQQLFNADQVSVPCHPFAKNFREEIQRLLIEKNLISEPIILENLHEILSDEMKIYNFDDGVNKISTHFYETDQPFLTIYHDFIKNFLRKEIIKEPFFFQATPTIRIHCPHGKNNDHYPRYHTDIGYGHPPQEINIWLPLTDILEGHGFRVMNVDNSKRILEKFDYDFAPFIEKAIHDKEFNQHCESIANSVETPYGDILLFDSRCIHSGEPLKKHTRISIDIRILPLSEYETMEIEYQGSGRRKILFIPGQCYHVQCSDEI